MKIPKKFVNVGLLVKDNNGRDNSVVNSWQIQQFWNSYHNVYIPHRSHMSVGKQGQGDDEAFRCLRLLAWGRLKRSVITNVSGALKVTCQTMRTIIQRGTHLRRNNTPVSRSWWALQITVKRIYKRAQAWCTQQDFLLMNQLCLRECQFWRGKDMTHEKKRVSKDVCGVS